MARAVEVVRFDHPIPVAVPGQVLRLQCWQAREERPKHRLESPPQALSLPTFAWND